MTIQGTFQVNGIPRNGATVKLWYSSGFVDPPEKNDPIPSGSPLQTTTTSGSAGHDGAYRFIGVASGDYYTSIEWLGLTVYHHHPVDHTGAAPYIVYVKDYGAIGNGTTDDTAAIQTAADVVAASGSGRLEFSPGTYLLSGAITISGSNLVVHGDRATLKHTANTSATGHINITGTNIKVDNLVFDGNVANQDTWSQHRHCIRLHDATDVTITNNKFTNIIGDGIYIARGISASAPYQGTRRVIIEGNHFIGTNANRQGISIICASGVIIKGNVFYGMTRADMIGAIDLEPNASNEFIYDVIVEGNTFYSGDNSVEVPTCIAVVNTNAGDFRNLVISNNTIVGPNFRIGVQINTSASGTTPVVIKGNTIKDLTTSGTVTKGIHIQRGKAVIEGNSIHNVVYAGIHIPTPTDSALGYASIYNNYIRSCRNWGIIAGTTCNIINNTIEDCGSGDVGTSRGGIAFSNAESTGCICVGNVITSSATGLTQTGILVNSSSSGHIFDHNIIKGVGFRSFDISTSGHIFGPHNVYDPTNPGRTTELYPPAVGPKAKGNRVSAYNPISGEVHDWVCVSGGTPGTWLPVGWLPGVATSTATGVTMTDNDRVLLSNPSANAARTITLASGATVGRMYTVKDAKGDAATRNITISGQTGNIDGSATNTISTNYGKVTLVFDGTNWWSV